MNHLFITNVWFVNHFLSNTWGRGWWTVKYCCIMRFTQTSSVFTCQQSALICCFFKNMVNKCDVKVKLFLFCICYTLICLIHFVFLSCFHTHNDSSLHRQKCVAHRVPLLLNFPLIFTREELFVSAYLTDDDYSLKHISTLRKASLCQTKQTSGSSSAKQWKLIYRNRLN